MAVFINPKDKKEISIRCSCNTPEHQLNLSYFENDWPEIYVTTQPDPDYRFWARVRMARKYIFSKERFYGIEMILDNEDIDSIIKYLNDFKKNTKGFKPENIPWNKHELKNPFFKVLEVIMIFFGNIVADIESWIDRHRIVVETEEKK